MEFIQKASPQPSDLMEVFVSYAHEDAMLRDKLAKHLSLLERQRVIKAWSDRDIKAGEDWKNVIDERIESANIILLLISADFLASDYCYDIELNRALERHNNKTARVIPVILRSSDWQNSAFGKLMALPTSGKAITSWQNEDEAFTDVVKGLRKAIEQLNNEVSLNPIKIIEDNIKIKKNYWLILISIAFVVFPSLVIMITYYGRTDSSNLVASNKCYQVLVNLPENKKSCVWLLAETKEKSKMFDQFREELEKIGFNVVNQKKFNDNTRPPTPEIRHFYQIDQQRAEIIAKTVKPHFPSQIVEVKYCDESSKCNDPSAREGYIELWLGR